MKNWIPFIKSDPHVAVIRLQGTIASSGRSLNDRGLTDSIEKAFRSKPKAVALEISSPGGSPVQSSLICARIRRLADEKDIPVYSFVEDVAASGGYWLATAGDEIYVDRGSIVGSIGVITAGFGLTGTLDKIGAERRVYTAGKSKSMLDPFQAEKPADVKRLKGLLDDLHVFFKDHVSTRRAGKIVDQDLFTGDIWVGQKSIDVGLADHLGHLVPTMKDRFGDKTKFRRFGQKKPFLSRFGAQIIDDAVGGIEERASYARFGL
ncbi:putative peptidase-domain-containing protein [Octadecabacter antarcticus 307]|uniref:Putative peptidase-domain-containing protein n=1 Tax=Octadecabacter antarcticus 307 TaxID=391626 RepID=M9R2D4_9RHOB|nr:S49 family peptidase [Octadecabacter antarcticus]AGI65918.1 putative peptidase-domain-containing protein [Octadecabacter antarcticus 307]